MADSFLKKVGDFFGDIVDHLKSAMEDEAIRKSIAEDLGIPPGQAVPKPDIPQDKLDSINHYRSQSNPDKEALIVLLNDVKEIYVAIRNFWTAQGVSTVTTINQVTFTTFDLVALNYFRLYLPRTYFGIQLFSALVEDSSALQKDELEIRRFFKAFLNALSFFLSPFYFLVTSLKASSEDEEQARRASEGLFALLAAAMSLFVTDDIGYGWDSFEDPSKFRATGFKDAVGFIGKLKDPNNGVSKHLNERFASDTKQLLDGYKSGTPSAALQNALINNLNQIIGGPSLFEKQRFKDVKLTRQTMRLIDTDPKGRNLLRLNWSLLEETYPIGLSRSATPTADVIADRMLTFGFPFSESPSARSELTQALLLSLAIKAKSGSDFSQGLFIAIGGNGTFEVGLTDKWKFRLQASAEPAFSILFDVANLDVSAQGPTDAPLNIALVSIPDETDVTYAFPSDSATRVEIGQIAFTFGFDGRKGGIKAAVQNCALAIGTKDTDGFLAKLLPKDGLRVPFNFGTGFSTQQGFFTEGNIPWLSGHSTRPPESSPTGGNGHRAVMARSISTPEAEAAPQQDIPNLSGTTRPELGIQQVIEIGKAILTVQLNTLTLGLSPATDASSAEAKVEVSASIALTLGPVTAVVDRIGFQAGLSFPDEGGNAGFANFSIGFKPPNGAGIKVDLPTVTGGGFLFFDNEKGQYAGFVQLSIHQFVSVKAIGLITTKLPNGEKGFSFLIMIMVEHFRPICLPLNFTLTAVGGLFAMNRICNDEFLREGLKNKTLDDILFPQDPLKNAPQIFGTLNNAFPVSEGDYLFAFMVQICWGYPPIITMNLGLILEHGHHRTRLVILGQLKAIMPSEKKDLLRLQMNALGVVDWDQNTVSIDAVLYDSRLIGKYPITGSMAMRLNWGSSPMFALSIGGFHPAFKPPANFPILQRLAISLSNSDNFRMRAEIYVAVTSNTLQFGGKLEMFAKAGGFSIEGRVAIDVLIQFDPFFFIADFQASVQLKHGSHNLFKIKVEGEISGPRPLHVKGRATFEIFWCDFSVGFDKTLVDGEKPPQLEPVEVMSQLRVALADSRNWTGQLAESTRRMVTLRDSQTPDQIALHPLGKLSVKQTIVPLELEIAKFGSATPSNARLFKINRFTVSGADVGFTRVNDFFPPAQFLQLSDDEKLAAPSFESMMAGITAGSDSPLFTTNNDDILEDEGITYETIVLDKANKESRPAPPVTVSPVLLSRMVLLGAAARSEVRRTGQEKYRPAVVKNTLIKKGWTIASSIDGTPQGAPGHEPGKVVTYSESFQALQKLREQNPAKAKNMMLLRVGAKN